MQTIALDAPVEGWDAFHTLDNMPPTAAIILDNQIPGAGSVKTRKGYTIFADLEVPNQVQTVASLDSADMSTLIAAAGGGLWTMDAGETGQAENLTVLAGTGRFASDKWQEENFRKADEDGILVMCNGVDNAQVVYYDSGASAWAYRDLIDTNGVGVDFIGCLQFKGRMYYWKDNDNAFYYAQAGAYEGDLKKFDLGTFARRGGKLVIAGSWTQQDSGDGKDDFIFFMFSTGEVILYQGDDPDTTGYWEMIGRYNTAEPLSIRGISWFGSDTILMTRDSYINLATLIQQGRTTDVSAFSRLIHRAVRDRTDTKSDLFGWDVELFPKEGLMVFNVPLSESTFEQHVLNTVTMRWCRFNSLNVCCLKVHRKRMFGGANDGLIYSLLDGTSDNGEPIYFDAMYAFNALGDAGKRKHLTAAQVLSTHTDAKYIQMSAYADYSIPTLGSVEIPTGATIGSWSINPADPPQAVGSFWDEDYWGSSNQLTTKGWQNVSAYGYAVALLVRFAETDAVEWRSTNLRYHMGGAH